MKIVKFAFRDGSSEYIDLHHLNQPLEFKKEVVSAVRINRGMKFRGMSFILVLPGSFIMGGADAKPMHKVTFTKPFYIGRYLVTKKQWIDVIGSCNSTFSDENAPIENVSFDDCQDFCKRMGDGFRLPTEAEWEYACLAGKKCQIKNWDSGRYDDNFWHSDNSSGHPQPVGLKKPNPWGLYDMIGNVREWCSGFYFPYTSEDKIDPQPPVSGSMLVTRGGGWDDDACFCRPWNRILNSSGSPNSMIGLRVVCEC